MLEKINKIKSDIEKLIEKLDKSDILGPIEYLEECLVSLDHAGEEFELYYEESDQD